MWGMGRDEIIVCVGMGRDRIRVFGGNGKGYEGGGGKR